MSNQPKSEAIDYNRLMQANLTRVFNERDGGRRIVAIRELYADGAVLHEPDTSAKGHAAIFDAVTALLAHLPPNFVFTAAGPAIGHHNAEYGGILCPDPLHTNFYCHKIDFCNCL